MTEQEKRENTIKGLECCGYSTFMDKCQECPYDGEDCFKRLKADALALLKAQEEVEPTWRRGLAFCSSCGRQFCHGFKYCPDCGRAVEWE